MKYYLIYKFGGRKPSEREKALDEAEKTYPGIFIYCRSHLYDPQDSFNDIIEKCTSYIKEFGGNTTFVIDRRYGLGRIGLIEETTARQVWPKAKFVEMT